MKENNKQKQKEAISVWESFCIMNIRSMREYSSLGQGWRVFYFFFFFRDPTL